MSLRILVPMMPSAVNHVIYDPQTLEMHARYKYGNQDYVLWASGVAADNVIPMLTAAFTKTQTWLDATAVPEATKPWPGPIV